MLMGILFKRVYERGRLILLYLRFFLSSVSLSVGFLSRSLAARRLTLLALPPSAARKKTTSRRVFLFPRSVYDARTRRSRDACLFCPPTWCLLARFPRLAPSGNYPRFTGMRAEMSESCIATSGIALRNSRQNQSLKIFFQRTRSITFTHTFTP